jgi:hypothetical protein
MGQRGRKAITYTLERAEHVRARVQAGERLTFVCTELGLNISNFLRWCRRNHFIVSTPEVRALKRLGQRGPYVALGQPPAKLRQPRPNGRAAFMATDLRAGLAPQVVAERYGVSYGYTLRLRREIGAAPPRGPGRNHLKSPHVQARFRARNAAILAAHHEGCAIAKIAQIHNLSRNRVHQIITSTLRLGS